MTELSERNQIWDTLVALFGTPTTSQQRLYGKLVKELKQIGATPEGMMESAMAIAAEWGRQTVTPTSLVKWYTRHQGLIAQLPDDPDDIRRALRFRELERQYELEALPDDTR